jgi:hypothetical protein
MDFYDLDHYLTWIGLYGDCKQGCKDKICKEKEMIVNGVKIKFSEIEVK